MVPVLVKKFEEEIESRGLNGEVFVNACSHIGGHKYAGNVIIYSQGRDGLVSGHWYDCYRFLVVAFVVLYLLGWVLLGALLAMCRYGYVTPDDVPTLIDQHIGKGEVIYRLWRFGFLLSFNIYCV